MKPCRINACIGRSAYRFTASFQNCKTREALRRGTAVVPSIIIVARAAVVRAGGYGPSSSMWCARMATSIVAHQAILSEVANKQIYACQGELVAFLHYCFWHQVSIRYRLRAGVDIYCVMLQRRRRRYLLHRSSHCPTSKCRECHHE